MADEIAQGAKKAGQVAAQVAFTPLQAVLAFLGTGATMVQSALRDEQTKRAQQDEARALNAIYGGNLFPVDPKTGDVKATGKPEQAAVQALAQATVAQPTNAPVVAEGPASLAPQQQQVGAREVSQQPLEQPYDPTRVAELQARDAAVQRAQDQRATMEALRGNIQLPLPPGVTVRARFGPGGTTHEVTAVPPERAQFASQVGKQIGDGFRLIEEGNPDLGYAMIFGAIQGLRGKQASPREVQLIEAIKVYESQGDMESAAMLRKILRAEAVVEGGDTLTPQEFATRVRAMKEALNAGAPPDVAESAALGARVTDGYALERLSLDKHGNPDDVSFVRVPTPSEEDTINGMFLREGVTAMGAGQRIGDFIQEFWASLPQRRTPDGRQLPPPSPKVVDDFAKIPFRQAEDRHRALLSRMGLKGDTLAWAAATAAHNELGFHPSDVDSLLTHPPANLSQPFRDALFASSGVTEPLQANPQQIQRAIDFLVEQEAAKAGATTSARILTEQALEPSPEASQMLGYPSTTQEAIQTFRGVPQLGGGQQPTTPAAGLPRLMSESQRKTFEEFVNARRTMAELRAIVAEIFTASSNLIGRGKATIGNVLNVMAGSEKGILIDRYKAARVRLLSALRKDALGGGQLSNEEREFIFQDAIPDIEGLKIDSRAVALGKIDDAMDAVINRARDWLDVNFQPMSRLEMIQNFDLFTASERAQGLQGTGR